MTAIIVIAVLALLLINLAGGACSHRHHYSQHGAHPNMYYTYGRGWYGSVRLPGGFRVGHRL